MKFKCDRDALSEALQTVQRAVSSRPGIPALTGVHMTAQGSELVLATTDLEVSARLSLGVQVGAEGVALVPARLLVDMVKSFDEAPVEFEAAHMPHNSPSDKPATVHSRRFGHNG